MDTRTEQSDEKKSGASSDYPIVGKSKPVDQLIKQIAKLAKNRRDIVIIGSIFRSTRSHRCALKFEAIVFRLVIIFIFEESQQGSSFDILGGEFRGSIFWLTPNTTYEVRVTGANVVTGTVTTRNDNPASTGNTYYVSPSGNDSNAGTQAAPWKTIGKATGVVNPGDTVIIRAGTYVGGFSIARSGTASNYITIKGADGETVILDGQNTNYNIFDVSGLADYLTVSPKWVYDHVHELPHFKLGGFLRFN